MATVICTRGNRGKRNLNSRSAWAIKFKASLGNLARPSLKKEKKRLRYSSVVEQFPCSFSQEEKREGNEGKGRRKEEKEKRTGEGRRGGEEEGEEAGTRRESQ